MDVIGNNIANVNTAGYKTSRVIFQDIFSQNVSAGMANQQDIGGTNPMQIGLGIRLSTVDVIHTRAAFGRTDKETDMMVNGDGYFIVAQKNPETGEFESFYTRAGNFDIDNEGYLVTSQGYYVLGRTFDLQMGVVDPGNLQTDRRRSLDAGEFGPGDEVPANFFRIGDRILAGTFTGGEPAADVEINEVNIAAWNNGLPRTVAAAPASWPETVRPQVNLIPERKPIFGLVASEEYIGLEGETPDQNGLTRIRVTVPLTVLPQDPVTRLPTGYPDRILGETDAQYIERLYTDYLDVLTDKEEVGLPGFSVADNGDISVIVGNRKVVIGRLAVGMFANPSGLEKAGNSLYRESASSGPVVVTEALRDGAGEINGGGLEMSNVDLANEFTDMIVTQRGFQANSRIITVSDTLLEELVNLKR